MQAREQPAIGMHHALFASDLPPFPQENEKVMGKHGITMPTAFAVLNPEQHAFAVDIPDSEARHFACAQAGSISGHQGGPVADGGDVLEELLDFGGTEHDRQFAGNTAARQGAIALERAALRGLWTGTFVPPWALRAGHANEVSARTYAGS